MTARISLGEQSLWVSSARLSALVSFALDVGTARASTADRKAAIASLRQFESSMWPGIDFDLEARFATTEEKKFWAGVFFDVARRIFLRQIGDHDSTSWQSGAIGDAYIVARILTRAVQQQELGWHPETESATEAGEQLGRIEIDV